MIVRTDRFSVYRTLVLWAALRPRNGSAQRCRSLQPTRSNRSWSAAVQPGSSKGASGKNDKTRLIVGTNDRGFSSLFVDGRTPRLATLNALQDQLAIFMLEALNLRL